MFDKRCSVQQQYCDCRLSALRLTKSISIPSIPSNVQLVERFLLELADLCGFTESVLDRIMISITEIVNNGIRHGNLCDPAKLVHLFCHCHDDRLVFIIRDEGDGFFPDDLPDPLDEHNLLKEGGRGVLIIRSMMDDVTFNKLDHGMEVRASINLDKS
jgi:serine/threonine-protein kinase RsbW